MIARLKVDLAHFTPESLASAISHAKNHLVTATDYRPRPGHPLGAIAARVYPAYQAQLTAANAMDFDDLLLHVAVLLRENPEVRQSLDDRYQFVLVDEYQDTNLAQYAIVRALSMDHPNLAVTGDPDQSIYGWRGANLNNILEFERDFPNVRVVRLERNYRSTKAILRVAAQLISYNLRRKQKDLYTENDEGSPVRLATYANQKEEARQIAAEIAGAIRAGRRRPRDYAVFYRVNALSWPLEQALREQGVPFQLVRGVEFFQRKEIKDVIAYLQLLNNPRDAVAFHRVVNTPARGIGKTTLDRLDAHAVRRGLSLLDAARGAGSIDSLSKSTAKKIQAFVAFFDSLAAVAGAAVEEILGHVLTGSGYKQQFEHSDNEEDLQRLANIEELLSVARDFDERHGGPRPLEDFLEETSLVNDTDNWEDQNDRVTLMTLHASKGLEFPVVYLVAAEEGLLPHERSRDRPEQVEEERRLMFVGITRAQEELQISRAGYRDYRGQRKMTIPSRFLMELPRMEMEQIDSEPVVAADVEPSYDDTYHHAGEKSPPVAPAWPPGQTEQHPFSAAGRKPADDGGGVGQRRDRAGVAGRFSSGHGRPPPGPRSGPDHCPQRQRLPAQGHGGLSWRADEVHPFPEPAAAHAKIAVSFQRQMADRSWHPRPPSPIRRPPSASLRQRNRVAVVPDAEVPPGGHIDVVGEESRGAVAEHARETGGMGGAEDETARVIGRRLGRIGGLGVRQRRNRHISTAGLGRTAAVTNRVVVPAITPTFVIDAGSGSRRAVVVPILVEPFLARQQGVRAAVGNRG